jgi:hypothetical protein
VADEEEPETYRFVVVYLLMVHGPGRIEIHPEGVIVWLDDHAKRTQDGP